MSSEPDSRTAVAGTVTADSTATDPADVETATTDPADSNSTDTDTGTARADTGTSDSSDSVDAGAATADSAETAVTKEIPVKATTGRGRRVIRSVIIGVGLVALIAASVLAGRLTSGGDEASAPADQQAEQPPAEPAADSQGEGGAAPAPAGGDEHDHATGEGKNPWLQRPDEIQEWSETITYTDPDGNPFTIHVELAKPTELGFCTLGPLASEYNRTAVISVRNDAAQPVAGPRIGVLDKRVGFAHGEMGCSWGHPDGTDAVYQPDEAKTFRGVLYTEPVDEDVIVVLRPDQELLRIPHDAFADPAAAPADDEAAAPADDEA